MWTCLSFLHAIESTPPSKSCTAFIKLEVLLQLHIFVPFRPASYQQAHLPESMMWALASPFQSLLRLSQVRAGESFEDTLGRVGRNVSVNSLIRHRDITLCNIHNFLHIT